MIINDVKISDPQVTSRIIIHGGAGNIRKDNLPKPSYDAYRAALLSVLSESQLLLSKPDATALDVATHAVTLLEDNPLFNCGKGAVFTRAGTTELESSIMVSNGYRKRGVGCMTLKTVKNPIKLAHEMLIRGEYVDGGGAQGHSQLSGEYLEGLAKKWGLEIVSPEYFFTQRRWDEHIRGLQREKTDESGKSDHDPSWDGQEYLPQGTVGAVVLDSFGTICTATSTGGLTNKLPGRIGDTPTLGAGFWAEEWSQERLALPQTVYHQPFLSWTQMLTNYLVSGVGFAENCLPQRLLPMITNTAKVSIAELKPRPIRHAVGLSGTGNGDSFLRLSAIRTAAAMSRFSRIPLATAVDAIAGHGGELERSAGDRWSKTGEGEGGIIGIELVDTKSNVVWNYNCGGMFRAWVDDEGEHRFMAFRDDY
ncbi:N-terminal nucleophile aminohydrolase [Tothia fuscella]|uniref:N-terminal nucleophile aminohydrolase n=1 Tax=Tothia fuscella TaxID=1048955 RepID=A0A9P4TU63_9PEZI|nr:N-terminal nucleophile aminohydrolase [Tothia fuscella]